MDTNRYTVKGTLKEFAVWAVQHPTEPVKWFETEDEARKEAQRLSMGQYDYSITRYPNGGIPYRQIAVFTHGQEDN